MTDSQPEMSVEHPELSITVRGSSTDSLGEVQRLLNQQFEREVRRKGGAGVGLVPLTEQDSDDKASESSESISEAVEGSEFESTAVSVNKGLSYEEFRFFRAFWSALRGGSE